MRDSDWLKLNLRLIFLICVQTQILCNGAHVPRERPPFSALLFPLGEHHIFTHTHTHTHTKKNSAPEHHHFCRSGDLFFSKFLYVQAVHRRPRPAVNYCTPARTLSLVPAIMQAIGI